MKDFTLVSTTFNEISRLEATIADIECQTLRPSEVIIADAGSTDGTYERLLKWQKDSDLVIKVLSKPKINVAEGRNWAIENATYNLIASTDFGCRFHKDWLRSIIEPFYNLTVKVVGGGYTVREDEINSLSAKSNYILSNGYTSVMDKFFIPSSRSIAYYKEVWEDAGRYQEWLTLAADDLVFGKVLINKGYKFYLVPEPYVYWGRHIESKGYGKEAFRYGLGDGEARVNLRQFIKAIVEMGLRVSFFCGIIFLLIAFIDNKINAALILIFLVTVYGFKPYWHAFKNWLKFRSSKYNTKVFIYSLYLIEITRWNYIKGYFKGYFFSKPEQKIQAGNLSKILNS